jgi:hypothetical protein
VLLSTVLHVWLLILGGPCLIIVEPVLIRVLLMTVVELVANTLVVHLTEDNLLKAIVVTTYLNLIGHHVFNSVVVPHNLNLANHALLS